MRSLIFKTPAKVNLGLRIIGRRDDGYHLLESLFAPIEIYDDLEFEWDESGSDRVDLELEIPASAGLPRALGQVTDGPDNLVRRAAELFRARTGMNGRLRIRLIKRIPSGAGLGGGSSDAGATLAGLSTLLGPDRVGAADLASWGLELGADVPFFLAPTPAVVRGIGEQIEPIAGLPGLDLVIANPGISVATAEVYRVADVLRGSLTEPGAGSTMRAISRLRDENVDLKSALRELLVNDLEPAALRICPPIGRLMHRLRDAGALGVGMSGSGGTVFGLFAAGRADAADRAERFAEEIASSWGGSSTQGETQGTNSQTGSAYIRATRFCEQSGRSG